MTYKDKTLFDVALESTVILGEDGNPERYHTIVIDIKDRKIAEEGLRQYECIVSSSFDMIALIDSNFVYIAANNAYLEAFSKTREELIGYSVSEIFRDSSGTFLFCSKLPITIKSDF